MLLKSPTECVNRIPKFLYGSGRKALVSRGGVLRGQENNHPRVYQSRESQVKQNPQSLSQKQVVVAVVIAAGDVENQPEKPAVLTLKVIPRSLLHPAPAKKNYRRERRRLHVI
jgi:hypothetical protein